MEVEIKGSRWRLKGCSLSLRGGEGWGLQFEVKEVEVKVKGL